MALNRIAERKLDVGPKVRDAVDYLKQSWGAALTNDSGQTEKGGRTPSPTWLFTLFEHGNVQVAMRMNRHKVSLYLADRLPDGRSLESLLTGLAIVDESYENPECGAPASLLDPNKAPYLCPGPRNRLLRLSPLDGKLPEIMALYVQSKKPVELAVRGGVQGAAAEPEGVSSSKRRVLSEEDFFAQLDRNSETGRKGEQVALIDELKRLHACGCPTPASFVELKARTDVGCGYDIASTWPGFERCIEVKTTTWAGSDFFLTENERRTLAELGSRAWLYRVVIEPDGGGEVVARIQDPMMVIQAQQMQTVVWRIDGGVTQLLEAGNE